MYKKIKIDMEITPEQAKQALYETAFKYFNEANDIDFEIIKQGVNGQNYYVANVYSEMAVHYGTKQTSLEDAVLECYEVMCI